MLTPTNQVVSINSSDGRIFDFNTPSSRVYLGETINSLLKPFGRTCVLTGLTIKSAEYNINTDTVKVILNKGEFVIDNTFITYTAENEIELDVSGYDENNGFLVLSIMFNFIGIMNKNYSKLLLTYVTNDGNVPNRVWYDDCENIVLGKLYFDKVNKTARVKSLNIMDNEKLLIENKQYDIYPLDHISKRILLLFQQFV